MQIDELTERAIKIRDLYSVYEQKKSYREWTAEQTYQGLVSYVGDLGRLVLSKEGFREFPDLEKNLEHEFAEILWATLVLSEHYGVDLKKAFLSEMEALEKRLSE